MSPSEHVRLMASYNAWMNTKLYQAAGKLSAEELSRDRGAFFRSIIGTLNHILVGDTLWLKRFAKHPASYPELQVVSDLPHPVSLDEILFTDLGDLTRRRELLDGAITNWANAVTDVDLQHVLHYANSKGVVADKRCYGLVMHFFNHQTHHRGQATTLLSQAGVDVGVTDLLMLIPNQEIA